MKACGFDPTGSGFFFFLGRGGRKDLFANLHCVIVLTRSFESVYALPFSVSFLFFGHLSSHVLEGAVFDPVCFV